MKKYISLLKATMSEGMNIFKINTKKNTKFSKIALPIIIVFILMGTMFSYSEFIIKELQPINMEFVLLTIFIIGISFLTIIEGIYKSGSLLFNCKDDNLLLSMPIKKSTVLFIRIFKFYIFELLYNSLFIIPSMFTYAIYVRPAASFYIVSFIGLLLFPIIPILISCLLGTIITLISSKFKGKNIAQTIVTAIFLLGVFYFSYNSENLMLNLAKNASNINNFITKLYYPAGAYIELITEFNYIKLLEFVIIHLGLFALTGILIGKIYFNINSNVKSIKKGKLQKNYKIKTLSATNALIKKEFNKFVNTPVYITNTGFGLLLFIVGCIVATIKFESVAKSFISSYPVFTMELIQNYLPIILFAFICLTSFMTSITSSMISLEGKSFNILKSLPLTPYKIVRTKILAAILIMIPCILIGDLIVFTKFKFNIIHVFLILFASILFPLISETIGIIINLKYPKMDAKNDTEVVKQSMSSALSVFIGMMLIGITIFLLYKALYANFSNTNILLIFNGVYLIVYLILAAILHKICDKCFENII